jgi:hypothetical protein
MPDLMPRYNLIQLAFGGAQGCIPALRANGSRECAPDDRLREAIQRQQAKTGLLRREGSSQ